VQSGVFSVIRKGLHAVIRVALWVAELALGLAALAIIINVFGRYVFRMPLKGAVEMVELLLVIIVNFSIAYTEVRKGHVTMDEVVNRFPRLIRAILMSLMYFGAAAFILIMGWQSWILAVEHTEPVFRVTDVLHLPIAPVVFVMAIGMVLFGLELLVNGFSPLPSEDNKKQELE
jgi:TRAP-type C4-dicarboxylate transport system permease small subunit